MNAPKNIPSTIQQLAKKERIGFIGLGTHGGPIARHLLIAGQRVLGYDAGEEQRMRFSESGGVLAHTAEEVVRGCTVVLTRLPDSETFVDTVETRMLPHTRKGQTFIDLGVVVPRQMRRVAKQFARKGAALLDAPLAGTPQQAESGHVRVFCGGELDAFERCRPLLSVAANAGRVFYCGASGMGQVVRGVDHLATSLVTAALLEAAAYGVSAGVRPEHLREAVGGGEGWRAVFDDIVQSIEKATTESVSVGSGQFDLLLDEALDKKFTLPLMLSLRHYLKDAEKVLTEDDRPAASYWRELTTNAAQHLRPAPPAGPAPPPPAQ